VHAAANIGVMAVVGARPNRLEQLLLRQGIGALRADRTCCDDCGRTPLVGEQVHLYGGRRPRTVCELCSIRRREEPTASAAVRHTERGHAVRVLAPAA